MDKEMTALKSKDVQMHIPRTEMPTGQQTIKTMWVFDVKINHLGYVVTFKARVVPRGDKQRFGIAFVDTFPPVARMATSRRLSMRGWRDDIHRQQGTLRVTPVWTRVEFRGNNWFVNYGFKQCKTEHCLYFYNKDGEFAIALLYVDDILCATKSDAFKKRMFEILDLDYGQKGQGLLNTYMGVQVELNNDSIKIHQTKYRLEIIERFNFGDSHPSRIPMGDQHKISTSISGSRWLRMTNVSMSLVGRVFDVPICTRPDLAFVVGQLSRYVQNPTQQHIGAAKRVLRNLIGTNPLGIVYSREKTGKQKPELSVDGYCDSDWGNDPDTRKRVTGLCIVWRVVSYRRQSIVAQSTAEAEYVA
eukprot:jgi/Phyca11/37299/gw1.2.101.1